MHFIQTEKAPAAIGPYSQAVEINGMVYTSGQIALRPDGTMPDSDIHAQTRQVLSNLSQVLEASGSALDQVVKTTIFLADMGDFAVVNEIYGEAFGTHKPVRSTVAVRELPRGALVEIDAIALVN